MSRLVRAWFRMVRRADASLTYSLTEQPRWTLNLTVRNRTGGTVTGLITSDRARVVLRAADLLARRVRRNGLTLTPDTIAAARAAAPGARIDYSRKPGR